MSESRHERLLLTVIRLPQDYAPWGDVDRETAGVDGNFGPDCSGQCKHYLELYDPDTGSWDCDWGVCVNPRSHRCGLLTFEHQGCPRCER